MTLRFMRLGRYPIFAPRSFKFCVVVDIEVTDKLGGKSKGVWHLGGMALVSIH